ncbi:hypothetical protein Fleli_1858 [Bernardetia litoralis DSM 6794]|uniref:DDE Tnp4 domain-containing protein n=1 Tax=Bernardetia litoralis (strain ATCC 23117 / DSM 6794 / NBRC 15988 / NCIMB 1366 / Fx l1 / Sio-4) TaxID=880071 RepID=I4AJX1_BERLS|nr:hypothetical protein Fleli_1858 [Bernardetia litoralis DSM 6794]
MDKYHKNNNLPHKKKKGKKLSTEQKKGNKELGTVRITVEHTFAKMKRFKIFYYPYRNRRKRFALKFNLFAAIHRYAELGFRKRSIISNQRGIDDEYCQKIIMDYLNQFKVGEKSDFEKVLLKKLPDFLDNEQKRNRIKNNLQVLRKMNK